MADNKYSVFILTLKTPKIKGLELDYRHSFSFIKKDLSFWKSLLPERKFHDHGKQGELQ